MKRSFTTVMAVCGLLLISTYACKKPEPASKEDLYPEEPLSTPSSSAIATFYKSTANYELYIYRYDPETLKWTTRIRSHFPTIPSDDPTTLGFTNPYVANSGIALFDMVRLYTAYTNSTNIKTVKINAPKVLQFFPDYEGAKSGQVKVIPQEVVLTRADASTFKIGIRGSGFYDERTGLIDLEVKFDEASIGGPGSTRKYKLSTVELILN